MEQFLEGCLEETGGKLGPEGLGYLSPPEKAFPLRPNKAVNREAS